jgi:Recombination endonuclease VII
MGRNNPVYKAAYYQANKEKMKACQKARYEKDPEAWKLGVRKRRLRKLYFPELTVEGAWNKYQEMLLAQNYLCAICGKPETKIDPQLGKPCMLAVDHCHGTKKVRALLCFRCNTNFGWFESMYDKFIEYKAKYVEI